MKKSYLLLGALLVSSIFSDILKAQCSAPSPPSVTGGTIAGCVSSAAFTLTGTPSGTNLIGWYANSFGGNALSTNSVFTTPSLTTGTTYYVGQSTTQTGIDTLAMPAYSINVPAMETRGYYFTAPVDFIITGLRVPVVIGGTVSGIAVVKLPSAPPLYANVTNSFNTLFLDQAITGTNVTSVYIPVYAGDIIGVLGERGGYSAYGPNQGTGVFSSTLGVGSTTVNLYRMGMLYNLATQTPTNLWTETVNTIGIVEMYVKQSCNSTLTPVTVSVVPTPTVVVAPPPVICANSSYTLSASGASTFTWSGGPQTSTYVITPSVTTTYSVQGSILSSCTSAVSAITVTVDTGPPVLTATSSSSVVCSGNTVALSGSGAPSFTWAGGTGTITNNTAFIPSATQQYTLYGSNSCGVSSTMISVLVNPTPTLITGSMPASVCEGNTVTLTVTGAATYSWNGAPGPGASFVVTPATSGLYSVNGISSAGCPAGAVHQLNVNPNPTVTAVSNKTLVCPGGSATVTGTGADSFSWNTGPQTATAIVNPQTTEIFTVTGTYTNTGCFSTGTVSIDVFSPTLFMSGDMSVCKGSAITLTANGGAGATYTWSTGSYFSAANVTVTSPGSYSVTVKTPTINGLACIHSGSVLITMHPDPTVQISSRTEICKGEKIILTASGGTAYAWKNMPQKTATVLITPFAVSSNSIVTYTVTGTDANGCKDDGTISVKINACIGIDEWEGGKDLFVVYPNPNNGEFIIQARALMQLSLVNELGQVIKELDFTEGNIFQQKVQGLTSGVYFVTGVYDGSVIQYKLVVME